MPKQKMLLQPDTIALRLKQMRHLVSQRMEETSALSKNMGKMLALSQCLSAPGSRFLDLDRARFTIKRQKDTMKDLIGILAELIESQKLSFGENKEKKS